MVEVQRTTSQRFVSRITRDTLALVLAGGRGTRLEELTATRVKPAVPFGGSFRIVDFPLSNCLNSGIRRIGVLTQYMSHSLIRHVQQGWNFLRADFGEYIELLPAQQRLGEAWYQGTADAVHQNRDIIQAHDPRLVLVLGGDHIYKMDYGLMLGFHVTSKADVTVGCMPVPLVEGSRFGIMDVDEEWRVRGFVEKPADPPSMPGDPTQCLASMGIYVFDTDYLLQRLAEDAADPSSSHDFGKDVLPRAVGDSRVYGFAFRDPATDRPAYWRDVGDIDSYWAANLELIDIDPQLNLYDHEWPIWTYQEQSPPAKFVLDDGGRRGRAVSSMVAGGCIVSGALVRHSLLFNFVDVDEGSTVEDSVVLPHTIIGRGCRIRRAVIDTGCVIPDGTVIGHDATEDARRFRVSPGGVVLVTRAMMGGVGSSET